MDNFTHEVDYMKLLYEDPYVSVFELDALHTGWNPNECIIDEECVWKSLPSFANKPLYGVIDNKWNPLDGEHNDFMEHFREEYPERITRDRVLPFGCVPESGLKDAKLVERDGKQYLRINVVVWKNLLPHVAEILKRRDGDVRVSVEFAIKDAEQLEDGTLKLKEFSITAITALGEKFREIMEGARLKSLRFSYDDYAKESNEKYFCFASQKSYKIPQNVLDIMKHGIEMRQETNRGGNKVVYNSLRSNCDIGVMYEGSINEMKEYFAANPDPIKESVPPTGKYILYNMYGGEAGREWVNSIVCNGSAVAIKNSEEGGNREVNVTIDNSKEAAVEGTSWDNPGKALYGKLLEASNTDSLVKEAYLVVENGYKDAPSEKLKYPHHQVKDGKLVLNVAGVKSAFARASQMGIVSGDVKKHLERHYRELGLSMENFEQKYAELEKQYTAKCAEFDEKCASLTASEEACAAAEEKCAGLQAELDGKCAELDAKCADYDAKCAELDAKCAELEEKCAKLGEYEKKEVCAKNMASIDKYAKCFSDEKVAELKKLAETCTCEEMDNAIAKCAMEFAELAAQNEFKFSYGFPGVNAGFTATDSNDSDLAKIAKKYNTIVR